MSPYITFKDHDKGGELQLYILQRAFPHFCSVLAFGPVVDPIAQVPISGHNLWLISAGTIRGAFYPSYADIQMQMELTLIQMAEWFYNERIIPDPKRYKKWLIPTSSL